MSHQELQLSGTNNLNRNCAFVNFTNISNAIKAIDGIKNKPEYANLRIAHGKDRCANPPRSGPQGGSGNRRTASGNGPANSHDGGVSANGDVADASGDAYANGAQEGDAQEMNIDGEVHVNGHSPSA